MPGIDINKFVDIPDKTLKELMCGICRRILVSPMITKCCEKTYCSDCINEWLTHHKKCPFDQKTLKKTNLSRAPKLIQNFLDKLSVKCDHYMNGCKTVLQLNELAKHSLNCEFGSVKATKKCKDCDFTIESETKHNCIENLKLINESISEELLRFREENTKLKELVERSGRDSVKELNMSEVIGMARKEIDNYVIEKRSNRLSSHLCQFYRNHCKEAVIQNNTYYQISQYIFKAINPMATDPKTQNLWFVWVFTRETGEPMPKSDDYFRIRFDKLIIKIFSNKKGIK